MKPAGFKQDRRIHSVRLRRFFSVSGIKNAVENPTPESHAIRASAFFLVEIIIGTHIIEFHVAKK